MSRIDQKKEIGKIDKILFVANTSKYYYAYQNWYAPFNKLSKNIISFDYRREHLYYGKEEMNKKFLELVKKEKPDFIFFLIFSDEFYPQTFLKIRELSPKTKTINFFGDDDTQFHYFSRFYALFFDYSFVAQNRYLKSYKEDGLKASLTCGVNLENFKFLNLEKKYDVTFIGEPKSDRYELIKYLKKNNIDIKVFGRGWEIYPDIKDIYGGFASNEDLVKIVNQSKINLCFTKNIKGAKNIKGRPFEMGACKSFVLLEYFEDYLFFFKEGKEFVMFKGKEDLLKKINYYLKHEKEREEIAENLYKRIINKYDIIKELGIFFSKAKNEKPKPVIDYKIFDSGIIEISEKEINLSRDKIKKLIFDKDYVYFKKDFCNINPLKKFFQAYSLRKAKKSISCCNCYISTNLLDNYLLFYPWALIDNNPNYSYIININQLMVTKDFFLKNLEAFKRIFSDEKINLVNSKNTVFINIPLVEIKDFEKIPYPKVKDAFVMKFLYNLYSLYYQKKLLMSPYIYLLLFEILKGKTFILKEIYEAYRKKSNWEKLKELQEE